MTRTAPTTALLIGALATSALAESDRILAALDANQDGALSREEFLVLREQMFARIDADGSGAVTKAEIEAAKATFAERARQNDVWDQDADGDGQLTLAEFTSATPGFDRADRDGDGVLSKAELDRIARLIGPYLPGAN